MAGQVSACDQPLPLYPAANRSIAAHKRPNEQNLFAIIQGGLDFELRRRCIEG